ncbi:aminotransferase class I/II-fold pyridoxal phosphate-dependent enzyme [Dermatophilaceae bacterium Soc4.6]
MINGANSDLSLTSDERSALSAGWNLADAHARQEMSPSEIRSIRERMGEMFVLASQADYALLEQESSAAFLLSMGQNPGKSRRIAVYSSSVASMIVARMLRNRGASVRLTCPTFDNVYALLVGEGLDVKPRIGLAELEVTSDADAIFEVTPNNPTGQFLDPTELSKLARRCADAGQVLILDQSFKGQVEEACFDHYGLLDSSGVSYVVIEDTGKLWPTLDLKVAFLVCSGDLLQEVELIVDDVLLNVSPFLLQLVLEYSRYSIADNFASIRGLIRENRQILRACLKDVVQVAVAYPESTIGVEVLDLNVGTSHEHLAMLDRSGIAALDTRKFYWSSEAAAPSQIRLALCREPDLFRAARDRLVDLWTVAGVPQ